MLAKEITWVLCLKILLMFAMSYWFFSDPISKKLTPDTFADAVFGTLPDTPSTQIKEIDS